MELLSAFRKCQLHIVRNECDWNGWVFHFRKTVEWQSKWTLLFAHLNNIIIISMLDQIYQSACLILRFHHNSTLNIFSNHNITTILPTGLDCFDTFGQQFYVWLLSIFASRINTIKFNIALPVTPFMFDNTNYELFGIFLHFSVLITVKSKFSNKKNCEHEAKWQKKLAIFWVRQKHYFDCCIGLKWKLKILQKYFRYNIYRIKQHI